MGAIFYAIGLVVITIGLGWIVLVLGQPTYSTDASAVIFGRVVLVGPGLGVMLTGFLLLAVGYALNRLKAIEENGSKLLSHVTGQTPRG